jgi:hypothetical protein
MLDETDSAAWLPIVDYSRFKRARVSAGRAGRCWRASGRMPARRVQTGDSWIECAPIQNINFWQDSGTGYASEFLSEQSMGRIFVGTIEHEHESVRSDKTID